MHGIDLEFEWGESSLPQDARRVLGDETYDSIASRPGMPEGGKGHHLYEVFRSTSDPTDKAKAAAESRAY